MARLMAVMAVALLVGCGVGDGSGGTSAGSSANDGVAGPATAEQVLEVLESASIACGGAVEPYVALGFWAGLDPISQVECEHEGLEYHVAQWSSANDRGRATSKAVAFSCDFGAVEVEFIADSVWVVAPGAVYDADLQLFARISDALEVDVSVNDCAEEN